MRIKIELKMSSEYKFKKELNKYPNIKNIDIKYF
jgi:hypothetical protein